MSDYDVYRKTAIRYWERRRIVYNLALILPALFGYFIFAGVSAGVGDGRHLGTGAVFALFLVSAIGANACYSLGYALEFLFGSDAPDSRWLRFWRPLLIVLGTLFSMLLALVGGRNIAAMEYAFR
jgi:TRAP-type C4-dicarboxylate transport system permease small subunit